MTTVEQRLSTARPNSLGAVGYLGAAAFVVASGWYALAVRGVTVRPEPTFSPGQSIDERNHLYFRWFASTLAQERFYTALAIGGFCCLAVSAMSLPFRPDRRSVGTWGAPSVTAGAGLWVIGNVLQLGGHHAVGLMATHGNPIETVGSISFTVDLIDDAFELAAFVMLGTGMLLLGRGAVATGADLAAWGRYTMVVAGAMLATAVGYAVDDGDWVNALLVLSGVALLPGWLVWLTRLERITGS